MKTTYCIVNKPVKRFFKTIVPAGTLAVYADDQIIEGVADCVDLSMIAFPEIHKFKVGLGNLTVVTEPQQFTDFVKSNNLSLRVITSEFLTNPDYGKSHGRSREEINKGINEWRERFMHHLEKLEKQCGA